MNENKLFVWPNGHFQCLGFVCTLHVPNLLNLTIVSRLVLILNDLWVTKSCHAHFKNKFLNLGLPKDCHQEKVHSTLSYLLYIIIFCLLTFKYIFTHLWHLTFKLHKIFGLKQSTLQITSQIAFLHEQILESHHINN